MRPLVVLSTLVFATAALAGCTAEGETLYSYDSTDHNAAAGGANLQDAHDTFEVPGGKAHISFSIGGSGSAKVTIKDSEGATMFSQTMQTGGAASSKSMSGASGTWSIDIDFTNFSGGFALSVTAA